MQCNIMRSSKVKYPLSLHELARQSQQSTGTASTMLATTVALHVHLESHLGRRVDSRLLITALILVSTILIA